MVVLKGPVIRAQLTDCRLTVLDVQSSETATVKHFQRMAFYEEVESLQSHKSRTEKQTYCETCILVNVCNTH